MEWVLIIWACTKMQCIPIGEFGPYPSKQVCIAELERVKEEEPLLHTIHGMCMNKRYMKVGSEHG